MGSLAALISRPVRTAMTPGSFSRGRGVDALDAGVGVRAAHEGHVGHAVELDVVDVGALAGDQARVLAAFDGLADELGWLLDGDHYRTSLGRRRTEPL